MWVVEAEHGYLTFRVIFGVLGYHHQWDRKRFEGAERAMCKRLDNLCRGKVHVPFEVGFHNYVYGTNWPCCAAMMNKIRAWEAKILRLTFRLCMKPGETWVGYRKSTAQSLRISWRKMGLPLLTYKKRVKSGCYDLVCLRGRRPDIGSPFYSGVRERTAWWRSRASRGMAWDPTNVARWKHKVGFHN